LIDKSQIEELYIGHNNLNGKSGDKIFNALSANKILKVLDYSFNLIGEDALLGLNCAKAIANCFRTNKHLQHLDLSFNSFNEEASRIIS
jgi:Ran GTPase-activating protein (RanGAP) involved in mRNA processing and transport